MIRIDATNLSLSELRRKFDPKKVDRADRIAIDRTAKKIRTQVSKDVRVVYNVKARDISSTVKIIRRTKGSLEQRILLYIGGHIPLSKFSPRQKKVMSARGPRRGVTVRVRKDRGRKLVGKRSGFHGAGFMTKGRVMARKTHERTSHRVVYGPAIPQMVANESVVENYQTRVRREYPIELERALNKLMGTFD
jgi:hypothetical protein